ncbi:unnamed protein product [Vitrella brassicaformis CCMP3155]|uniref:Uncharacterized protein n=1 Tax=Vitrella brassicaformis (strain CCMP3155) TaxID=1169540 RepID=A0A0G4EGE4_VITBC|nr:unnamed protein product [Vitrella brassicaformis CCMP3155]|eukprot:CEL94469.1 unnamed protein product [Vitrella brassicaformis CCMP3155]
MCCPMKRKAVDEPITSCESSNDSCSDWDSRGARKKRKARRVGNKTVKDKGGKDGVGKKGEKRAKKTKALTPDVDMEVGPEDALKALSRVAQKLQAQLNMINAAKAKDSQVSQPLDGPATPPLSSPGSSSAVKALNDDPILCLRRLCGEPRPTRCVRGDMALDLNAAPTPPFNEGPFGRSIACSRRRVEESAGGAGEMRGGR